MIGWIVSTLAASSALMLLVLVARRPVAHLFGPTVAYALWLLPALRMVLPPLPEAVAPALPAPLDVAALLRLAEAAPLPATANGIDWTLPLAVAWLGVAALRYAGALLAYRRFMARTLAGGALLGRERGVAVWRGGGTAGPLAAGVFRRRIVLPYDFHARFAGTERRLALAHEATHHARFDTAANAVALAVLALHWWNPIAHRAWRAFRADQEMACDAAVLRDASPEERHAYGSAVLKAAFGGVPAAACGMRHATELKRRLRMMAAARRSVARSRLGQALAGAAIAGGLVATATGGAAAERVRAIGERVREVLPPIAPSPPVVPVAPARPAAPVASAPPRAPERPATPRKPAPRVSIDGVPYVAAPPERAPAVPRVVIDGVPYVTPPPPASPASSGWPFLSGTDIDRAVAEARREAGRNRVEALRAAALDRENALRAAALDREHALRTAMLGREDALRAAAQARAAAGEVPRMMATARAEMARAYAGRGRSSAGDRSRSEDCDRDEIERDLRGALVEARRELEQEGSMPDAVRRQLLMSLDREIARRAPDR